MIKRNAVVRGAAALGLVAVVGLTHSGPASADTGAVTVTATNNAAMSITMGDASADFGSNLDPSGTNSGSSDTVLDYQGSTGNQGTYYVWKGAGTGLAISVKSNKVWNGTVGASANSGSAASMSIGSGALRYAATEPTSYGNCTSGTAFSSTAATWASSQPSGTASFTYFYCLRVDWNDDIGTFGSTVTYTATQV